MKAFTLYSKEEINLRILMSKLEKVGIMNCDFKTFSNLYNSWHLSVFKNCPVDTNTANFRDDWFGSFVMYLAKSDIV